MAHILFISRYYLPEKAAAAVCVSETAKCLIELGHQVTVLTTVPNYPTGVPQAGYRNQRIQEEVMDGVRIVRIWSYLRPNKGFLWRVVAQLSFGCLAPFIAWKAIGKLDVIVVGSPPLFNVIAARTFARLKHIPFIFWVADLWPESAIQVGMLRNRLLIRLSEWLEWSTYLKSEFVWVVTSKMRDMLVERGLSPERLFLLTNGVNTEKFQPMLQKTARLQLGWDNRFSVLYIGNHGLVYGMTALLEAAELMLDQEDVHFIFVGDGARKKDMIEQVKQRNIKNITFLDAVPHETVALFYAAADVSLAPLAKMSLVEGSIPLKMLELMACSRPYILGGVGVAAEITREANAGLVVEPENAEALVSAIQYLRANPDVTKQMGLNGRAYAQAQFDYKLLTERLNKRLSVLLPPTEERIGAPLNVRV